MKVIGVGIDERSSLIEKIWDGDYVISACEIGLRVGFVEDVAGGDGWDGAEGGDGDDEIAFVGVVIKSIKTWTCLIDNRGSFA